MRNLSAIIFSISAILLAPSFATAQTVVAGTPLAVVLGGTNGQVQYNNSGSLGGFTLSGDCTVVVSTGAIICLKTNGNSFGTAATVNTGTSGVTIPLLNGVNTWSSAQTFSASNFLTLANLPQIGANTILGNATASTANIAAQSMPSCSGASNALIWTTSTGFGCNTISGSGAGLTANTFTDTQTIAEATATNIPLVISGASITGSSTNQAGIKITGTLNTTGNVLGAAWYANLTNTGSGAGTSCLELDISTVSKWNVDCSGNETLAGGVTMAAGSAFSASGRGAWYSPAAGSWQEGKSDVAAPVAQTLGVQNVVAGTSNTNGQNWTINGSKGTGTGTGGSIIFQTAPAGTTGTSQNAEVTVFTLDQNSHQITGGGAPTCGTGCSSVTGNDSAMVVTTGSAVTSIAVNFNKTWASAPTCIANGDAATGFVYMGTPPSTTVLTLNASAAFTSDKIYVRCSQ